MKLIEDDGTVIQTIGDDDGILLFTKDGVTGVLPKKENNEIVPEPVMLAAATMIFMQDEDNRDTVMQEFQNRIDRSH